MIYNTFKDIEREYRYAQDYLIATRDYCAKYLRDVLFDVGSIEVMVDKKPALLVLKEKRAVIYQNVGQARELDAFGIEELYAWCKQVREMRLVQEYGDSEEGKEE